MGTKLWSCEGLVDSDGRCYNDDCQDPAHSGESPPPTLAEACEVIEALLKEPGDCACDLEPGVPCMLHAPARAFLARVKARRG